MVSSMDLAELILQLRETRVANLFTKVDGKMVKELVWVVSSTTKEKR